MTDDREWMAAKGVLAGGVANELAAPLARVHKILADAVDKLDNHVAHSRGPEPLPWNVVSLVREELMDAYLEVGRAARLAGDLAVVSVAQRAMRTGDDPSETDLNDIVERAVALARHRIVRDCELLLDLGSLPPIRVDGARLAQAVAHIILSAADEAETGSTIILRTSAENEGTSVLMAITHSFHAGADQEPPFAELVRESIFAEGGRLAYVRAGAQVTAELTFPIQK